MNPTYLLVVQEDVKVTYTYSNVFIIPVVIEMANGEWACQLGCRLFTGDNATPLEALAEILSAVQKEAAAGVKAIAEHQKKHSAS